MRKSCLSGFFLLTFLVCSACVSESESAGSLPVTAGETPLLELSPSPNPSAREDFSIVILPDTQYYSASYPQILREQTQWLLSQGDPALGLNQEVDFVLGVGDIVDDGRSRAQWENAHRAFSVLDGKVPYFLSIGNHDYDRPFENKLGGRGSSQYARYFGPNRCERNPRSQVVARYSAQSPENFAALVTVPLRKLGGSKTFLLLALEFNPRNEVLRWADEVLTQYSEYDAFAFMHSYMNHDDTHVSDCDLYSKRTYGLHEDNNGDEVWQKVLSRHAQLRMVFSGHIPHIGVGRRFDLGTHGNLVHQMLSDYQNEPQGGNGWLRILRFDLSENHVQVETFSPYFAAHPELYQSPWRIDERNQFELPYTRPSLSLPRAIPEALESNSSAVAILRGTLKQRLDPYKTDCSALTGYTVRLHIDDLILEVPTDSRGEFEFRVQWPGFLPGDYREGQVEVLAPLHSTSGVAPVLKERAVTLSPGLVHRTEFEL